MNITVIADTHGLHDNLKLEAGEMLINAGDITEYGTEEEVVDFIKWFEKQPFKHKIFIAGNHDLFLETCTKNVLQKLMANNVIYLQNSDVTIKGIKIWGSPVSPYFLGMAFNKTRGNAIQKVWNKIPSDTDILITHTPPKGIMDIGLGCEDLLNCVKKIKPKLHLFGHIHDQLGLKDIGETRFINAAVTNNKNPMLNEEHKLIGRQIRIDYLMPNSLT